MQSIYVPQKLTNGIYLDIRQPMQKTTLAAYVDSESSENNSA